MAVGEAATDSARVIVKSAHMTVAVEGAKSKAVTVSFPTAVAVSVTAAKTAAATETKTTAESVLAAVALTVRFATVDDEEFVKRFNNQCAMRFVEWVNCDKVDHAPLLHNSFEWFIIRVVIPSAAGPVTVAATITAVCTVTVAVSKIISVAKAAAASITIAPVDVSVPITVCFAAVDDKEHVESLDDQHRMSVV